jgi:hypothetical protein
MNCADRCGDVIQTTIVETLAGPITALSTQ